MDAGSLGERVFDTVRRQYLVKPLRPRQRKVFVARTNPDDLHLLIGGGAVRQQVRKLLHRIVTASSGAENTDAVELVEVRKTNVDSLSATHRQAGDGPVIGLN